MKATNGSANLNGLKLYTIEHGIALPADGPPRPADLFKQMRKGDSVVLPHKKENKSAAVYMAAHHAFGKGKYAIRRIDPNHVRVWRTA